MMRHVAVFTWKPGTTAAQVQAFASGLAALPGQIAEIRAYHFGPDAGLAAGNGDFALVADFDDGDAWRRYQDHPVHQQFIVDTARPILEARHAVQFRVD
jgi:hypothetical protein